ncbi:protein phosphatase 1 regulatory subunit 3C-B [Centropristis striata]|uniref:protein phosphatase 1 regulatory subunit 3C-B n=1 Tax=Centropristis striata TaxID=184440 RepID=UPI0027E0BCC6|nr:protein phosphatase 1 regulatory subunit 3C-B [Centropristis striata]
MNCARVLHAIGSHPQPAMMPVDLATCLSLSRRQPLYQLLSMSPVKPTQQRYQQSSSPQNRTGLHSPHPPHSPTPAPLPSEPRSCFRRDSGGSNKKRVVFADAVGLALTAVRLFVPEPSSPAYPLLITPSLAKLQSQQSTSNKLPRNKLRLGFPPPTLDPKAFLARLRDTHVQLESCNISEHSLSGKVRVCQAGMDKAVHVRVTFDSWRTHHDVPCTFLQQQHYRGSDMDVFAFEFGLPKNLDPKERVEFCVSFRPGPGATAHWDNNRGQNYRVCVERDESNGYQGDDYRFYPTLSQHGPSHVSLCVQNSDLNRSLASRVRAEYKALCSAQ